MINTGFWRGKRVFLTGHTGFKGGWLSLWLESLGAETYGYALQPETIPNLYAVADVERALTESTIADIRDADKLVKAMQAARPELVFHMAAQPLVRQSYIDPVETYSVNVMGTVNLLEAVRKTPSVRAVINVTTDKCYANREWVWAYRENEPMGGYDPYSSSKACAELVTSAYRCSFLGQTGVGLASVRAGNVIGGGDWASDRLIPDILRAFDNGRTVFIRSPNAVRPWQHVLEPLAGYLLLGEKLFAEQADYAEAWNFGPRDEDVRPVQWIVEQMTSRMPGASWQCDGASQFHEAIHLKLDSSKARIRLGWQPRWSLASSLGKIMEWHLAWRSGKDMRKFTLEQIHAFESEHVEDR